MLKISDKTISYNKADIRRHSFSGGEECFFKNKIKEINNTPFGLRRSEAISNLALPESQQSGGKSIRIEYKDTDVKNINSKDYVYCGSAKNVPVNYCGMSIDKDGYLVLIKGKSYDLFSGLFRKYTTGYKFKTSQLIDSQHDRRFETIFIDDAGLLVGKERHTGKNYFINISATETDVNNAGQYVNLELVDSPVQEKRDELTFKIDNDYSASYFVKDNKLYIKEFQRGESIKDYSCLFCEIKIPLSLGYSVSSIKKTMGILQVEVKSANKRRILFIDPKHISHDKMRANKVSHKPPQSFSSRVGNDPHEKYHAGLPFTSDRKANFSSKHIPLFSSIIDTFRGNIKKAKQHSVEGRFKEAVKHGAKAIDPGIGAVCATVPELLKSTFLANGNKIDSKEKLYAHNLNILASDSKPLSKVINDALGVKSEQNFSESLINLAKEIKPRDNLHLTSSHRVAAFFGIAAGGLPFFPGWFAGIVSELSDSHNLTIAKTENGNIRLSFTNRHKVAATVLAGTGQGLERTVVKAPGVDYMTVMPFEANAIIAAQSILGDSFSFDMSEENFNDFARQFSEPEKLLLQKDMLIDEAKAEKIKEKELLIRLEAKAELRAQVGSMVHPSTYMVMPRTAVGTRLALDLLKLKHNASETSDKKSKIFCPKKESLKITAIDHEAALFAEWKIMPVVMHGGGDNILWCYPFTLLEENKDLLINKNKKSLTLFERGVDNNNSEAPVNIFYILTDIEKINNIPALMTISDKKGMKRGVKIKNTAGGNKSMALAGETLAEIKKSLVNKQRSSQDKFSEISVITHYEPISSPASLSKVFIEAPLSKPQSSEVKAYRLKKLEFRRNSSLQKKDASVPMPILSLSTAQSIVYEQYLGGIEFIYNRESDVAPTNIISKLLALY